MRSALDLPIYFPMGL